MKEFGTGLALVGMFVAAFTCEVSIAAALIGLAISAAGCIVAKEKSPRCVGTHRRDRESVKD